MSARPPDGSDQPEAPDQVMLAVLSNAGREAIVLSSDEERLLDDWAAGRLALVHERSERFKAARRPAATALAVDALAAVPAPLRTPLARAANSARMFNLSVSNVPAPTPSGPASLW